MNKLLKILLLIATTVTSIYGWSADNSDTRLLVSKTTYDVNEEVDVLISNYNIYTDTDNWVGIYRKDQPSNAWEHVYAWNWIYPDSHGSAFLSKKLKDMPAGEYEARLFFNNSYQLESKVSFNVYDADTPYMTLNQSTFEPSENVNEQVDIIISNYNTRARDNDWVGIYRKDQPSNAWEHVYAWDWIYPEAHGSAALMQKIKDMPEGEYEVRLFFNNSFKLEATVGFSVAQSSSLKLSKVTYSPNEEVAVTVTGELSGDEDWVGVFRKGQRSDNWDNVIAWNWVEEGFNLLNLKNEKMPAGEYEARLFFHNSYNLESKVAFTVVNADDGAYKFPPNTQLTSIATRNIARPTKTSTEDISKASVKDPQFGSTITLLNRSTFGFGQPKTRSWNADMTLLYTSYRLYDANTLKESPITRGKNVDQAFKILGDPDGNTFRWSSVDPKVFYTFHSGANNYSQAWIKNTIQADNTVEHEPWFDFEAMAEKLKLKKFEKVGFGTNEAHLDRNDEWVVFTAKKYNDDHVYALLCNAKGTKQEREKCIIKKLLDTSWGNINVKGDNRPLHDWISITPNGDRILEAKHINVAQYANGNNHVNYEPESRIYMYDLNFENRQEIAGVAGHGDIGLAENGDQVYVQNDWRQDRDGGRGVIAYNLDAPAGQRETRLLPDVYDGGHISCQNYKRLGWCYVSTRQEGYRDVFALKLDGSGTVNRFVQTRISNPKVNGVFIDNSPYAGVSPDGKRIIFSSHWGNGGPKHVYHAVLKK